MSYSVNAKSSGFYSASGDVVHTNLRMQPFTCRSRWGMHLRAVTGFPMVAFFFFSFLQQLCKDGLKPSQNTHHSSMPASCQFHLRKHPSLRWEADKVSNRAHIEPFLEPLCHCLASYSSEDDALIFSRTVFPLPSCSQVLVTWLGHWLCWSFIMQWFAQPFASWFEKVNCTCTAVNTE